MKSILAAGIFSVALAIPLGVSAQQNPPPAVRTYRQTTPSVDRMQHRWARRFRNLNLSADQQQRIQALVNRYSQAHPAGSPRDRVAARQLRRQVMGVLTSDQQNQFRQERRARRAQIRQRRAMQGPGNGAQGPPDQQYQQPQGPPDQQYQQPQGPPNQQYQQPQGPPAR